MFALALVLLSILVLRTDASPIVALKQSPIYGPYGTNATNYGPKDPGQFVFSQPSGNHAKASGDQLLFQNLLAAEWIVDSMYAAGLATFNASDFVQAGYPNDTLAQLRSVYENENGHLRLFESAIESKYVTPSRCKYEYGFERIGNRTLAAQVYMNIVSEVEIGSMAYLTGLARQAQAFGTLSTIMGTISSETRHLTFVNGQVLQAGNFVGPTDTTYPWPLQILSNTKQFIVPNSCPSQNPTYPSPDQKLPKLSLVKEQSAVQRKDGHLTLTFAKPTHGDLAAINASSPAAKDLHAIFFHSVFNYTVPAQLSQNGTIKVDMPELTSDLGNMLVSLSNTSDVRSETDIVAGPLQIQLGLPYL